MRSTLRAAGPTNARDINEGSLSLSTLAGDPEIAAPLSHWVGVTVTMSRRCRTTGWSTRGRTFLPLPSAMLDVNLADLLVVSRTEIVTRPASFANDVTEPSSSSSTWVGLSVTRPHFRNNRCPVCAVSPTCCPLRPYRSTDLKEPFWPLWMGGGEVGRERGDSCGEVDHGLCSVPDLMHQFQNYRSVACCPRGTQIGLSRHHPLVQNPGHATGRHGRNWRSWHTYGLFTSELDSGR